MGDKSGKLCDFGENKLSAAKEYPKNRRTDHLIMRGNVGSNPRLIEGRIDEATENEYAVTRLHIP